MHEQTGISDSQAREVLRRAAELDQRAADVIPVETLRAAAREAGIADSSFAAALGEHTRGELRELAARARRRRVASVFAGAGAAGMLLLGAAILTRLVP